MITEKDIIDLLLKSDTFIYEEISPKDFIMEMAKHNTSLDRLVCSSLEHLNWELICKEIDSLFHAEYKLTGKEFGPRFTIGDEVFKRLTLNIHSDADTEEDPAQAIDLLCCVKEHEVTRCILLASEDIDEDFQIALTKFSGMEVEIQ